MSGTMKMAIGSSSNMELWDSVCETDPAITKHVSQRGGFTAICAQVQLKAATRKWGPYGSTWGVQGLQFTEYSESGKPIEVMLSGTFWYPGGEFPIATDMAYKPGNDTRKKLLTDLTTKALSKLGFNSDVFEGKFDDNKYVAERRKKHNGSATASPKPGPALKGPPNQRATLEDKAAFMNTYVKGPRAAYEAAEGGVKNKQFAQMLAAQLCDVDDTEKLTRAHLAQMRAAITDKRVNLETGELLTTEEPK